MSLKSLEINGFKSFGKKSTLDFTCSITAIVGPNGSGKSNVAEAFRFVLGEQSLKSMRGKKGEDLIFNGSNDAPRGNRAGVKLIFDNKSRIFNIDFDEVVIERVVFRDGGNEYFINGSKVRLKDILELLAVANIGASGHHIISQGEADRILHSNPKERREMIEDALGIKIYQYKKEESLKKLQKTDENIKQVEGLRREIAPHLKFLKKQVEKIEKAKEVRDELIKEGRIYFKKESIYIREKKEELFLKKKQPETELKVLETKLRDAKKTVEEGMVGGKDAPEIIEIEKKLDSLREKKNIILRELGKIEGELSYVKKSIDKEIRKTEEEDLRQVYLKDVEKVERLIADISSEANKSDDIDALKKAILQIQESIRNFIISYKAENSNELLDSLKKELDVFESRQKELDFELDNEKKNEETLIKFYEEKREELEKAKDETREAEKEIFRIVAKQNEVHSILEKIRLEERQVFFDEEKMKNDISELAVFAGVELMKFEEEQISFEEETREKQSQRRNHLERLKIRLEETGISGGDDIMKEHKDTEERDVFLAKELFDLENAKNDLEKLISELEEKLDKEFKNGVIKINDAFSSYFTVMFGGGHASLKVVKQEKRKKQLETDLLNVTQDEEEKVDEGVEIEVSLPHKKIKGLMMLSGGERALTSIALLFAISQVNPPPFVILDETDAALDEANSRKYGDMVENLAKHSELIVITHNRETMSRAGVIYGVTMGKDATSKLLSISFKEAEAVAK